MPDANDLSSMYNTELTPDDEAAYQAWATKAGRTGDVYDYDMRGAWKAGAGQAENGHYPDTYKKPNHPTFSRESQYSGQDGFVGGEWVEGKDGAWIYKASPSNLHWRNAQQLQEYFNQAEPDTQLQLPQ